MSEETRERILGAAAKLFGARGLNGVTIRDITAEAEVNVASVNYHFGSKEALFYEMVRSFVEPINRKRLDLLDRLEEDSADGALELEAVLEAFMYPVTDELVGPDNQVIAERIKLMSRIMADLPNTQKDFKKAFFGVIMDRFLNALQKCLPGAPRELLQLRFIFVVGSFFGSIMQLGEVARNKPAFMNGDRFRIAVSDLCQFVAGGLRAEWKEERRC